MTAFSMETDGNTGRLDDNTFLLVGRRGGRSANRHEDVRIGEQVHGAGLWQFSAPRRIENQWPLGEHEAAIPGHKRPAS